MPPLLDHLKYFGRVAYELPMFLLLIPFYVFHESAHAIAALPWGGPAAAYVIFNRAERGVLARIPVGAAIYHHPYDRPVPDIIVTLAPLALIAPGYALLQTPSFAAGLVGSAVLIAGIGGLTDLLHVINADLYDDFLIEDEFEYVRVIDFTKYGLDARGLNPPKRARRDDL